MCMPAGKKRGRLTKNITHIFPNSYPATGNENSPKYLHRQERKTKTKKKTRMKTHPHKLCFYAFYVSLKASRKFPLQLMEMFEYLQISPPVFISFTKFLENSQF